MAATLARLRLATARLLRYCRSLPSRLLLSCRLLLAVARLTASDVGDAGEVAAGQLLAVSLRKDATTASKEQSRREAREPSVLAVDIGGTRTKFLLVSGSTTTRLPPAPTARIWQNEAL